MEFKFYCPAEDYSESNPKVRELTEASEIFDPKFNTLLRMPNETKKDYRNFIEALFKFNGETILKWWSIHENATKFLTQFREEIAREDWYVLGLLYHFQFDGTFFVYYDGEYTNPSGPKNVSSVTPRLQEFFLEVKENWFQTRHKIGSINTILPGIFGTIQSLFVKSANYQNKRKSLGYEQVLELFKEGAEYKINCSVIDKSYGIQTIKSINKLEIETVLTYSQRSELYKVFEYSTNVITTVGERDWRKGTNDNLFGVELEMATDYQPKDIIDAFPDIFCILKKDSSVTGNKTNKVELVTIPASLRVHKKMWANFFKNTNEEMFDLLDKHNNGMHVHIDRAAFDEDTMHLKKFLWFFSNPANYKFLLELSERDEDSMKKWSKFVPPKTLKNGSLDMFRIDGAIRGVGDKNVNVNLNHSATVEVRMFKGIVTYASVIKNIEFVEALVEFSRYFRYADMTVDRFLSWIKSLPNSSLRALKLCLEELDIESITVQAEIDTIVKGGNKTNTILDLLNKRNFDTKYTKYIVQSFNDKFGDLGFKLKREDNKFVIIKLGTKFAKFSDQLLGMYNRAA